ncbi:MAG: DUF4115 domain-containing protein [Burkholderiales bacterium]|nr:DUF4115 domain-containing protein [Burkholderiales bacterium]
MTGDNSSAGDATLSPVTQTQTAGERLRRAREAAGWSIDDVATKLKLAPRQIAAIEASDWASLPERTFTRGFLRSYARLVGIDPDSMSFDASAVQVAEPSALRPAPESMGEIAFEGDHGASPGIARWAVPLGLLAVLVAGAAYFWGHLIGLPAHSWPGSKSSAKPVAASEASASPVSAANAPASAAPSAPAAAEAAPAGATVIAPPTPGSAAPAPATDATPATVATPAAATPAATTTAPATSPAPAPATVTGPLIPGPTERRVTLTFKGKSWTEVRSKGEVVFSETAMPGTREFTAALPLSFTVGNASNVVVTLDGKPYDMSEMTRNDVARFRIE